MGHLRLYFVSSQLRAERRIGGGLVDSDSVDGDRLDGVLSKLFFKRSVSSQLREPACLLMFGLRWHEGRRVWASLTSTIRTLQRTLAYSLPPRIHEAGAVDAIDTAIDECLALTVGYAYALK